MKGKVSVLLDAAMCISFIAFIYTLIHGKVQWETSFFKFTIKNFLDPIQAFILVVIIKVIYDSNNGIFSYFSRRNVRILSYVSTKLCMLHKHLYYWHHKTDAMGFRNPADRTQASIVLLGDSMVYGHGVEETSTIRHHLEILLKQ